MERSHAGQPCRRSVESDASRWYREEVSANLDGGPIFAPVAQYRGRELKIRASVGASPTGSNSPRYSKSREAGLKNQTVRLHHRSGHQWKVNRTSVPGLGANEIG